MGRRTWLGLFVAANLLIGVAQPAVGRDDPGPVTDAGRQLATFLDGLDVEHLWLARGTVDWQTGKPDGRMTAMPRGHTHCSAFVASAAERLGIYILRPPTHSPKFLANAQEQWLRSSAGMTAGWNRIGQMSDRGEAIEAVGLANRGEFVVAIYRSPLRHGIERPGHVAIIRPSNKALALIASEGPDEIQAGRLDFRVGPLREGFKEHKAGWRNGTIEFFAHRTKFQADD